MEKNNTWNYQKLRRRISRWKLMLNHFNRREWMLSCHVALRLNISKTNHSKLNSNSLLSKFSRLNVWPFIIGIFQVGRPVESIETNSKIRHSSWPLLLCWTKWIICGDHFHINFDSNHHCFCGSEYSYCVDATAQRCKTKNGWCG